MTNHDYTSPRSDRRADRLDSAEVHYLGEGPTLGADERAKLFELLARLALPVLADTHSLYRVAHQLDWAEASGTFFYAVRRRGAVLTWHRGEAEAYLSDDPDSVLYVVTVRRGYDPERINAYVSTDTRWREIA